MTHHFLLPGKQYNNGDISMVMISKVFRIKCVTRSISSHKVYWDCLCSMRLSSSLKHHKFIVSIKNRERLTQETRLYYGEEDVIFRISFLVLMLQFFTHCTLEQILPWCKVYSWPSAWPVQHLHLPIHACLCVCTLVLLNKLKSCCAKWKIALLCTETVLEISSTNINI